jgi:hypothetical protein
MEITPNMSNHDYFATAFQPHRGEEFSTAEIKAILRRKYPEMSEGSMLPNDHAYGNKSCCWCAGKENPKRLFDRVSVARYRVR